MKRSIPLILALLFALTLGLTACGGGEQDDTADEATGRGSSAEVEATATPAADIQSLTGRDTTVKLDKGFLAALKQLKVTPGTLGTAKLEGSDLSFPITGGWVSYFGPDSDVRPYVQGRIEHDGSGMTLEAGGKEVELTNFVVNPGTSTLTGKVLVDGKSVTDDTQPLFFLDGRTLENPAEVDQDAGTATLTGTTVELKQEAAGLLNQTFGIKDLKAGLKIGTATIVASLPAPGN